LLLLAFVAAAAWEGEGCDAEDAAILVQTGALVQGLAASSQYLHQSERSALQKTIAADGSTSLTREYDDKQASQLWLPVPDITKPTAIALAVTSVFCWGSWPNTFLLAKTRFELYFLNYMLGNSLVALALAVVVQKPHLECGDWAECAVANFWAIGLSIAAGLLYGIGAVTITNAIKCAGMSIAVPIISCIEFALGVPLMLFVEGFGVREHWGLSMAGVAVVLLALALDGITHNRLVLEQSDLDAMSAGAADEKEAFGKDHGIQRRRLGLFLAVLSGLSFTMWPCLASIVEGHSTSLIHSPTTMSFSTFYAFQIGSALFFAICSMPWLARYTFGLAESIDFWTSYFQQPMSTHALGILGGCLQGIGTILSLEAGMALGNALGLSITRCAPVVSALWGWLYWDELRGASINTRVIFTSMIATFLVAVALLGWASAYKS
jgi:glucose uptake protein